MDEASCVAMPSPPPMVLRVGSFDCDNTLPAPPAMAPPSTPQGPSADPAMAPRGIAGSAGLTAPATWPSPTIVPNGPTMCPWRLLRVPRHTGRCPETSRVSFQRRTRNACAAGPYEPSLGLPPLGLAGCRAWELGRDVPCVFLDMLSGQQ